MDERDGHRALAHRAGHALDRAGAHVAGHEHAGHAGLEHVGVALERPAVGRHVGPGEDEAALVAGDHAVEPVGARRGADEHEAGVGVAASSLAVAAAHAQRAPGGRRPRPRRACVLRAHLDVLRRLDLLDQVVRHRRLAAIARARAWSPGWRGR